MTDRLFAIGDIHGCARELEVLLAGLPLAAGDTVACVGDYIDRGPASRQVIDLLLALRQRAGIRTVFLKGNHEDMCLSYVEQQGLWGEGWHLNGGVATLRSYGIDARLDGREVATRLPATHLEFLRSLVPYLLTDRYLLVHAGIRPGRALVDQDPEDLFWIREEFILTPHSLPQTIVFGHTPQRDVLVDVPSKIGIDTGCVYGGALTALELRDQILYQVRLRGVRVTLAHPERSSAFERDPARIERLHGQGVLMQVNADALLARPSSTTRRARPVSTSVWALLMPGPGAGLPRAGPAHPAPPLLCTRHGNCSYRRASASASPVSPVR